LYLYSFRQKSISEYHNNADAFMKHKYKAGNYRHLSNKGQVEFVVFAKRFTNLSNCIEREPLISIVASW